MEIHVHMKYYSRCITLFLHSASYFLFHSKSILKQMESLKEYVFQVDNCYENITLTESEGYPHKELSYLNLLKPRDLMFEVMKGLRRYSNAKNDMYFNSDFLNSNSNAKNQS